MSISRRSSLPVYAIGLVTGALIGHVWTREASTSVEAQTASVDVTDTRAICWHHETLKSTRGHELSFHHVRRDGSCRLGLYTRSDGVSLDIQQQVDVRLQEILNLEHYVDLAFKGPERIKVLVLEGGAKAKLLRPESGDVVLGRQGL